MPSNKVKPSLAGGSPEDENATLVAPPELAAQLFGQHPPEGPSENATLRAPPELAARLFGPPSPEDPSEKATGLAPPELGSQELEPPRDTSPSESMSSALEQLRDTSPTDSMSRALEQLRDTSPTESMSSALEQLRDATADARAGDAAPNLDSLVIQFGAASRGEGDASVGAPPMRAAAAPAPGSLPRLRTPSVVDLQAIRPEGAGLAVLTPGPPPTLKERVRDAVDEAVGSLRETGAPKVKGALSRATTMLRTKVPEHYAKLLDFVRARLPERHRGISQRALGLGVGGVLLLPALILVLILALSGGS